MDDYREHTCSECHHFDPPSRVIVHGKMPDPAGMCRYQLVVLAIQVQVPDGSAVNALKTQYAPTNETMGACVHFQAAAVPMPGNDDKH